MTHLCDMIPCERAGDRKRREAATKARKAHEAQRRPVRQAIDLLLNADREKRTRADYLAAMTAEHAAVLAEIAQTKVRLATLKSETLPAAQAAIESAQARVDALAGDVERAAQIADAQAVLDRDSAR